MKIPTFEQFKKTFTNGAGRKERRFFETYGDVSFEEAYPIYCERIKLVIKRQEKISDFEKYLQSQGVEKIQSNISESRYYYFGGIKFRFSNHVYPTGSMTSETCVDFTANPEMIDNIKF